MSNVLEVTDNNFDEEVLIDGQVTLVDFWATWCGPCRKLSAMLDEISAEFEGKAKFVKIKADENTETATKYSVSGVPSILIFKGSEVVERMVNIVPKSTIISNISKHL